jgi:mannose/fructose-specific phosphotransferase system component IIA
MVGILLVSHGEIATALFNSATQILEKKHVNISCFY